MLLQCRRDKEYAAGGKYSRPVRRLKLPFFPLDPQELTDGKRQHNQSTDKKTGAGKSDGTQFSRADLLQAVPGLAHISTERVATHLVVEALQIIPEPTPKPLNEVTVEGIVSRIWARGSHQFVRLAVYDAHTPADGRVGKNGRPYRKAHYVSVHFIDGMVNGRHVRLEKKERLRVLGRLSERRYRESLAMFLLRAGQIGLLANVPNADDVRETRVPRSATYIIADAMIQFAR